MNIVRDERGFTLLELMVVVVILGVLAALVVPRFVSRDEQAKRTAASVQIKSLEEALGLFKLDNGFYPSTEQGLQALVSKPTIGRTAKKYRSGGYVKVVPKDPWSNPFVYISPGAHGDFDIVAYGADGEPGGDGDDADVQSWSTE